MRANRSRWVLFLGMCAICSGLACSGTSTGPDIMPVIHTPYPPHNAHSTPVFPVFAWLAPEAAVYFDLLAGSSQGELSAWAESLETNRFIPASQLRPNREYFWKIVAYNDSESWESQTWRFVTVNPQYVDPITPTSVLTNPEKAWQARDVTKYDSLLAPRFRYIPSVDEPYLNTLSRAEDLDATRKLFRSSPVLETSGGLPSFMWTVSMSRYPSYPAEQGYRQADLQGMTLGLVWESADGVRTRFRLPHPDEAQSMDGATGVTFYLEPSWHTTAGDTVWKVVEVLDYYVPPHGSPGNDDDDSGHGEDPGEGHWPIERTVFASWGFLKKMGSLIEE